MEIIKSSTEITALFEKGRRLRSRDLTLIVLRNEKQHGLRGRAAFVAGKKQGNAVWRNRAKRRMRALCRELGVPIEGYDIIFLAKRSTNNVSFDELVSQARKSLKNGGLK